MNKSVCDISQIRDDEPKSILLYEGGGSENPKYSIIIPTYKRNEKILRTLNSAINQSYGDYEIILIDNNDDFDNKIVLDMICNLKSKKLKYYKNEKNLGAEGNFNRGIQLARGEYFAVLHDDDFWEVNFLEEIDKSIEGNKAVFTKLNTVYENERIIEQISNAYVTSKNPLKKIAKAVVKILYLINVNKNKVNIKDVFLGDSPVGVIGVVYNRLALVEVGGFNREFFPGTDYELNCRYVHKYGGKYLNKELANYVIGENDSLVAAKKFAKFNYELRSQMMNDGLVKNNKANRRICEMMYYVDKKIALNEWGLQSDEIEDEIRQYSEWDLKKLKYKKIIKKLIKYNV